MGSERRDSERRRAARLSLGPNDRPTLHPCPSCAGQGKHILEDKGRYRGKDCVWCGGSGAIDHFVLRLWIRWLRIRNVNRDCPRR